MIKMSGKTTNSYTMMSQTEKANRGLDMPHITRRMGNLRDKVQRLTNNKGGAIWKNTENSHTNG